MKNIEEEKKKTKWMKMAITEEADRALMKMLDEVNSGWRGGRVGKQELVSWLVRACEREGFGRRVEAVRAEHFDQVVYLASVVRELRSKAAGDGKADLAVLLAPLVQGAATPKGPKANKGKAEAAGDAAVS